MEINFNEWEEITHDEYKEIPEDIEVLWMVFHKGSIHSREHYFKRETH